MKQKLLQSSGLLFLFLLLSLSQQVFAEEPESPTREEVITTVKNAYNAQISLTEKARSMDEIKSILSKYFEAELIESYINENVQPLGSKFIVYGTDFPVYTIPFFTYTQSTKVRMEKGMLIVYEYFPATTEGPVVYDDHYEVMKFEYSNDGWKINSIDMDASNPEVYQEQQNVNKLPYSEQNHSDISVKEEDLQIIKDVQTRFILGSSSSFIKQSLSTQSFGTIFFKTNLFY